MSVPLKSKDVEGLHIEELLSKTYYKFSLIEANKSTSGKNSKLRMAVIFIKQLKKLENEKALLIREIEEKNLCIQVL